jgi:predicted dehydrogenase
MALRVAIAGAGMIVAHHLPAWRAVPGVEVVAIADPDRGRAEARAAHYGIPSNFTDPLEMMEVTRPDVLDVASPRETHAALVLAAAARGIDVLCQKPLAPTLAEAEALVAAVAGRVRLMVHENWRFRPYYRQVRDWQQRGLLGEITGLTLAWRSSGFLPDAAGERPALRRQPFMATEPRLLVAESPIHHIDVARWLGGGLRLLAARMQRLTTACVGETAATLMFEAPSGAPVVVEGNGACPGYPPAARDHLDLIGTRGSLRFDGHRLSLLGGESRDYDHDVAYQACFDACIAHFVACLRDGRRFETEPADNLQTLALVEDAYRLAIPDEVRAPMRHSA